MNICVKDGWKLIALSKVEDGFGEHYNALLEYSNPNKFERVVAWGYNIELGCWGQGHYFTLFYDDAKDENKISEMKSKSLSLFKNNYMGGSYED